MRNLVSCGLALLLIGSMLWGQCASCPMFEPATTESHDCCHPDAPAKQKSPAPVHDQCPNDAVSPVNYSKAGLDVTQLASAGPVAADVVVAVLPPAVEAALSTSPESAPLHAPPDLCVLHSILLV